MLLSTEKEAEITITVGSWQFSQNGTGVIVKRAHNHSVLCSLAFFSIYRNLCGTVAGSSLGTNLSLTLPVSLFSCHHLVVTATSSSWSSATPAGSSSRMWRDCHAKSYADYSAALTISFLATLVSVALNTLLSSRRRSLAKRLAWSTASPVAVALPSISAKQGVL